MRFLERLQSVEERVKRRWIIWSSTIIMLLVVYFWLAYFNNLVATFSSAPPTAQEGKIGFSFAQTMKNGTAILYEAMIHKATALGRFIAAPQNITIQK